MDIRRERPVRVANPLQQLTAPASNSTNLRLNSLFTITAIRDSTYRNSFCLIDIEILASNEIPIIDTVDEEEYKLAIFSLYN